MHSEPMEARLVESDVPYRGDGRTELAAKEVGPLDGAMNALRNTVSDLRAEMEMLTEQLRPVLQPWPEAGDRAVRDDPAPPRSSHVMEVDEQRQRIAEQVELVRGLRNYLDVR